MTSFSTLTELWHDGDYIKIGKILERENWSRARVAQFCAYFCKYMGVSQLEILYKFI